MNRPYGHYGASYGFDWASMLAETHKGMPSRTIAGKGGWTYKQFANGDILIVGAPKGFKGGLAALPNGGFYSAQAQSKQWVAITKELGATGAGVRRDALAAAAAAARQLAPAIIPDAVAVVPVSSSPSAATQTHTEGLARFAPAFVGLTIAGVLVITALVLFSMSSKRPAAGGVA